MSANVHNAILGPVLRVGTIPSANATPNFAIPNNPQSLDGGLITNNGQLSGTIAPACWWIGPDGQNSAPILDRFITDGFKDIWSGCWYDPIYSIWGAIPSVNRQNVKAGVGYLQNLGGAGAFSYSTFPMPLFTNQLFNTGFYSQSSVNNGLYGGYANNFSYSSIDNILLNSKEDSCGNPGTYQSQTTIAMPYGTLGIGGLVRGAPYSGTGSCPLSPYVPYFTLYLTGPNYRSPNGNIYSMINENTTWYWFDKDGNWHNSIVTGAGMYLGRLWNGFVFIGMFTNYSGCVYTEDMIIFHPLLDITGNIDFTTGYFGLFGAAITMNFFMSGFGFSYLANYYKGISPLTQAAYKIYPAFNFSPLIPDKFFVPNVCGCNNSAPILKNGVIQHA